MSKAAKGGAHAASSSQQAKLPPFDESKLKPIHTAIDAGQYKPALKLLSAALQKYGQQPVLRALQALTHAYLDEAAEARVILASLPPLADVDGLTRHTLIIAFRAVGNVPSLLRCYELSIAADPKAEELQVQYFFALTRTHDYTRLQTAAMKLYTSFRTDKYLLWSALNLLLMRRDTPPNTLPGAAPLPATAPAPAPGADKMMQLLELMLSRSFAAPNFPKTMSPEELLVLLRIYSRQLKWTEALRLLDSDAGAAFKLKDGTEYLRIRAQLLRDSSLEDGDACAKLAASNAAYEELCRLHNDDWFFLCQYIEGEFQLARKQQRLPPAAAAGEAPAADTTAASSADATVASVPHMAFDERISKLRTFLQELQTRCTQPAGAGKKSGQPLKRGPFLAEVELEYQLWRPPQPSPQSDFAAPPAAVSSSDSAAVESALCSYFAHFGSKSCFFFDVLSYMQALDAAARARIVQKCLGMVSSLAEKESGKEENGGGAADAVAREAAQVRRLQLSLSVQQLMRYNYSALAAASSPVVAPASSLGGLDLESAGQSMFEQWLSSTRLSSSLLRIASERGLGDHYLLLFAHHYLSLFLQNGQRKYLLDVILALELALAHFSANNFAFKLWLIRLYTHPAIGAFARAAAIYRSMDIKQIQHDITSHLMLDDSVRFGHILSDTLPICNKIQNWHAAADREDVNSTELAYTRANYTKVLEFVDFRERRVESFARYTAAVLSAHGNMLKLGTHAPPPPTPAAGANRPAASSHAEPKVDEATNSKDIVNVHALLKKSLADLASAYPSITDHSTSAPLSRLVVNNDYTIVTVWDAPTSALSSLLNSPAPALFASSFDLPHGELLRKKDDDTHTHHASAAQLQQMRFFRVSLELVWHMLEQNAPQLRQRLPVFQQLLVDMRLLDLSETNSASDALASFDAQHWRLCFLLFESSACVVECAAHTSAFMDAAPGSAADDADKVAELNVRWSSVHRQFTLLAGLLDSITADLSARFFLAPEGASAAASSEEARAVVYGDGADVAASSVASLSVSSSPPRSADPRALRDAAALAQFGSCWLTLAVQVWATGVPSKKAFQKKAAKKHQAAAAAAATAGAANEPVDAPLQECVLSVRVALASLIKAQRASLHTLQALCKRVAGRAKDVSFLSASTTAAASPSASSLSSASSVLSSGSFKSTLPLLQTPEHAALVHTVLQYIDSSHGHAAAQLQQLFASNDQPLQHVKL